jgi:hypothetical protein
MARRDSPEPDERVAVGHQRTLKGFCCNQSDGEQDLSLSPNKTNLYHFMPECKPALVLDRWNDHLHALPYHKYFSFFTKYR